MTATEISSSYVIKELLASSYQFKDSGEFLREGICPSCGQKTLYVGKKHPWIIRCNRSNKCGFEEQTRQFMPSIFEDIAKKFPPTESNRQATADVFLAMDRGFDLSKIRTWYEQAAWPIPGTQDYIPTVRFYLDEGRTRWWERLIGRTKKDGKKAHFGGRRKEDGSLYAGDAWVPPGQSLEDGDRCFIVEGIFHAIALVHAGYKAIAAFSCGHFPATYIEANAKRRIRWTLALDSDNAGKTASKKHYARLKADGELCSMCLLPEGKDWDDLWRTGAIDQRFINDRLFYGRLFLASSIQEKAYIYYKKYRRMSFLLEYENSMYSITLDKGFEGNLAIAAKDWAEQEAEAKRKGKATTQEDVSPYEAVLDPPTGRDLFFQYSGIDQISNVLPQFLYMDHDDVMDERHYVFRISYPKGNSEIVEFEGTAVTSPDAFHKALLNRTSGGTFDGDVKQLKRLRDRWFNKGILTVSSRSFIGYDKKRGAYLFQNHAWYKGRCITRNEHDYFMIGRQGLRTRLKSVKLNTAGKFDPSWLKNFAKAFHWQGMATLAFWLGSLFVQQIRHQDKTFPFLELTGEPGAGKSTILEFLWKCVGRDDGYEGFDILKSTVAGRRRAFSQVSNLPVVVIESDRVSGEKDSIKQRQFCFDEVKPFFNGRATGTLGVAKRSNDVDEDKFQAALVISQNAEVEGSEALLQRIVHCHADKSHHQAGTREIARWFERQTSDEVGGFLGAALSHEREILEAYSKAFEEIEERFSNSTLRNERIIKNHAQVAACGHALGVIFPSMDDYLKEGLTEYLFLRAKAREKRLAATTRW